MNAEKGQCLALSDFIVQFTECRLPDAPDCGEIDLRAKVMIAYVRQRGVRTAT